MTRTLAFIATTGLIGAAAFLTIGVAMAGPNWADSARFLGIGQSTCGPVSSTQRQVTLPLAATDRLAIHLPATVHYQPGGAAEAVISGDPAMLSRIRFSGGELDLDCDPGLFASRLQIKVSGPPIARWEVKGSGDLTLSQINQPKLGLVIKGSGSISATGIADAVALSISGSGDAELKELAAQSVQVEIRGSGDATLTAKADADVVIYGSGDVELFGRPVLRRSEVRGSGNIAHRP